MKTVVSVKDVENWLRSGADPAALPAEAIYTPAARDLLREHAESGSRPAPVPARSSSSAAAGRAASDSEAERLFRSPEIEGLKRQICDIGRRLWQRAYVDGNGGNISIRLTDRWVLCTPTLVSKGFMQPEDMCLVDLEGNQAAGARKRTSEILMHLQIFQAQPKAKACVHAHPPYATAFAVSNVKPPTCMIPEMEVFCGEVGIAPYFTPGTPEMGRQVASLAGQHNTILMANHGVVAWSHLGVEDAYFKMEIIEAYCRTVVVTTQLGGEPRTFSPGQLQELLAIKQKMGVVDRRIGLKECELCDNRDWRPGVVCQVPPRSAAGAPGPDPAAEAAIQAITDQIMARLQG